MTRINVVPPEELCDQHLLAEHREITRIPNMLLNGKLSYEYDDRPEEYRLGDGHVKFFTDKLHWLYKRWTDVHVECIKRGFDVENIWPWPNLDQNKALFEKAWNDWKPDSLALRINRARIRDRMPVNARWSKYQ